MKIISSLLFAFFIATIVRAQDTTDVRKISWSFVESATVSYFSLLQYSESLNDLRKSRILLSMSIEFSDFACNSLNKLEGHIDSSSYKKAERFLAMLTNLQFKHLTLTDKDTATFDSLNIYLESCYFEMNGVIPSNLNLQKDAWHFVRMIIISKKALFKYIKNSQEIIYHNMSVEYLQYAKNSFERLKDRIDSDLLERSTNVVNVLETLLLPGKTYGFADLTAFMIISVENRKIYDKIIGKN